MAGTGAGTEVDTGHGRDERGPRRTQVSRDRGGPGRVALPPCKQALGEAMAGPQFPSLIAKDLSMKQSSIACAAMKCEEHRR
ncbi:hypothetical protein MDA_GLEAN10013417 [Myotis davidii]|uniref:Uncharacterized protein n=1 Tax=Myotis davidii TaxID=225400 RepID=L5LXS4_MYODS|nr:hypothetical protein MDA_GLEAN10013417 [Myotis davidii]